MSEQVTDEQIKEEFFANVDPAYEATTLAKDSVPVTSDVSDVLLPCPFCNLIYPVTLYNGMEIQGCEDDDHCDGCSCSPGHDIAFAVCCDKLKGGCGATGGYATTKEKALQNWNTRAQSNSIHRNAVLRPNVMQCPRCKLRVTGILEWTICPNGCGPLWGLTWESECKAAEAERDSGIPVSEIPVEALKAASNYFSGTIEDCPAWSRQNGIESHKAAINTLIERAERK